MKDDSPVWRSFDFTDVGSRFHVTWFCINQEFFEWNMVYEIQTKLFGRMAQRTLYFITTFIHLTVEGFHAGEGKVMTLVTLKFTLL